MTACGHPGEGVWCAGCCQRLRHNLRNIPELYQRLEVDVLLATPIKSPRGMQASEPIPLAILDVLLLRVDGGRLDGLESLEGWCRVIIEERDFHWPPHPPVSKLGRLSVACNFLWTHSSWVCEQPWVDELAGEVGEIHLALRRAIEPTGRWMRTRIAHADIEPAAECPTYLLVDRLDPGAISLICRTCDAYWAPEGLAYLLDRPITVHDAAALTGVSDNAIRMALKKERIANRGTEGAPLVSLDDIWEWRRAA